MFHASSSRNCCHRYVVPFVLLACVLLPGTAWANSYVYRGIITTVNAADQSIVVELDWSLHGEDDMHLTFKLGSNAIVLLDEVRSHFADACKQGHAVIICKDVNLFRCFRSNWRLQSVAGPVQPDDAWWTIRLPQAVATRYQLVSGKKTKSLAFAGDLLLHLDIVDGRVQTAFAARMAKGGRDLPWFEIDTTKLSLSGSSLSGQVQVTYVVNKKGASFQGEAATNTEVAVYDLTANASDDGKVTGSFEGRAFGRKASGALVGSLQLRPDLGTQWRCWGHMAQLDNRMVTPMYLSFGLSEGVATVDCAANVKCQAIAMEAKRVSLEGGHLQGEFACADRGKNTIIISVDARLIGDRFFGTYSRGDDKPGGRIAGRLHKTSMPSWAFSEGDAKKLVKQLQEAKK